HQGHDRGYGFWVKQGAGAVTGQLQVANLWVGNTPAAGLRLDGVDSVSISGYLGVGLGQGAELRALTNSSLEGIVKNYNRASNGGAAVSLDASSNNTIQVRSATDLTVTGYNGIVEVNGSSGNSIFGAGVALCSVGLQFGGAVNGLAYVSGAQACSYEVNGRTVQLHYHLGLSAKGTSTGVATLAGLPFAAAYGGMSPFIGASGMMGLTSPYAQTSPGSTTASLAQQGTTGSASLTDTNFSNSSVIIGSLIYIKH
ncbi:hypothetical protein, partial [Methylobacterium dankookense]